MPAAILRVTDTGKRWRIGIAELSSAAIGATYSNITIQPPIHQFVSPSKASNKGVLYARLFQEVITHPTILAFHVRTYQNGV